MTGKAPTKTHRQMVEEWKQEPEFKEAYDELEMEFTLLRELLLARQQAGLTQAEVAEKDGDEAARGDPARNRFIGQQAPSDNCETEKICPGGRLQA